MASTRGPCVVVVVFVPQPRTCVCLTPFSLWAPIAGKTWVSAVGNQGFRISFVCDLLGKRGSLYSTKGL